MLDSLWVISLYIVLLFFSIAGGIWYATYYRKRSRWESSGIENSIVGIFGLIISFTFLQAGNAHRERFAYLHKEANNADALYRYSREMPDSFRLYTKKMLQEFLKNQLAYEQSGDIRFFYDAKKQSDAYWANLTALKREGYNGPVDKIREYFDQLQDTVSLFAYSNYERTPAFVTFLLVIVSMLIGVLVGFMNGVREKIHYMVPVIYFVTVSLTMLVISDLNNPRLGLIKPSYYHLQLTLEYIRNN
ncbi:bestrophin-like domain [Niabella drilacis]|uniref:DUF4239 domain-containing protein n=1 Tax=Niabella drilacis (strain DSM 25811 / CCM 8410 / CCUG 62505 / LMG 26954 / E90) TaxID=1285928 RepID=A0A1G7BWN0_NIADE|nr:hypothetical protein [Niabella drilacis]SDE30970.1 hypothetical protein SAMN04487894_1347 [Niabella drilacis]